MYAMFRWVRLEYGLRYELPVVWDTGRGWLKYQAVLIIIIVWITLLTRYMYVIVHLFLLHCLISYPSLSYMHTLHFMWINTFLIQVYSTFYVFSIAHIFRIHTILIHSWCYNKVITVSHWYRQITIFISVNIIC